MLGLLQHSTSAVELNATPHPDGEVATSSSQRVGATRLDRRQVLLDADEFVTKHNLHDIRDLIRKGALLCHEPHDFVSREDLTEDEIASLRSEEGDWSWSWSFTRAGAFCCLAGPLFLVSFGIPLLECPIGLLLSRRLGRRKALCAASIFAMCSTVGRLSFRSWPILLITRLAAHLLAGIAIAILMYTMPLYLADHSLPSSRGRTMASWHIAGGGVILRSSAFSARGLEKLRQSWLHVAIIPVGALLIVSLPYMAVESPHQAVLNGQINTALQTLYKTRPSKLIAARDLYRIHVASISRSKTLTRESSTFDYSPAQQPQDIPTLSTYLANPTLRRATVSSVTIMLAQTLIIPIYLHMPDAIENPQYSEFYSMLNTFAFVLLCLLKTTIDRVGRRRRLLSSLILLEFLLFLALPPGTIFYSLYPTLSGGVAIICTIYAAEVFPSDYRETGFAITIVIFNTVLVFVRVIDVKWSTGKSYYGNGVVCFLVSFVLVYFLMRETRKVAFEDMEQIFEARTRDIVLYRVKVVFPYLFRRYILWRQVKLEPFEESRYNGDGIRL